MLPLLDLANSSSMTLYKRIWNMSPEATTWRKYSSYLLFVWAKLKWRISFFLLHKITKKKHVRGSSRYRNTQQSQNVPDYFRACNNRGFIKVEQIKNSVPVTFCDVDDSPVLSLPTQAEAVSSWHNPPTTYAVAFVSTDDNSAWRCQY